jgi:hypothetical protein
MRTGCAVSSEWAISAVLETQNVALYGKRFTGNGSTGMDIMCECLITQKNSRLDQTGVSPTNSRKHCLQPTPNRKPL